MSPLLIYTLALAAVLFVVSRRFVRPRTTWDAFRRGAEERARTTREELLRANEAISDAEALQPVLAALAAMPLPEGVTLRIDADRSGAGQARVEVTSPPDFYILLLTHSRCRRAACPGAHAGPWFVTMERTEDAHKNGQWLNGGHAAPADKFLEEAFDDLAAYTAQLQKLITAPPWRDNRSPHVHDAEPR